MWKNEKILLNFREATGPSQQKEVKPVEKEVMAVPRNAQQLWTDDDLATLAKYIKKYPGGTTDRWEKIAESMER